MSISLFCTDLDGTLLGNPTATAHFSSLWTGLKSKDKPLLVYNTGRNLSNVQARIAQNEIPNPDYIIANVGTVIFDTKSRKKILAYPDETIRGWDRNRIENIVHETFPNIEKQPDQFQTHFKSSWYIEDCDEETLASLQANLLDNNLHAQLVYSNNIDLDILPDGVDKGAALAWLCKSINVDLSTVLVAGDRGNDIKMFELPNVQGIVIDNAQPDLATAALGAASWRSQLSYAEGVIDGLKHYKVLPQNAGTAFADDSNKTTRLHLGDQKGSTTELSLEEELYVHTGYEKAIEALRKNITPMGFSAASLADNTVTGTDENYRSVWGRDGAITVIQVLKVDDEDLRACAKQTLITLLDATAPSGQVPANVRIDTGEPDYSGVGGICAIDSAMWVVIALYHYVTVTGDTELMKAYESTLEAIMTWLLGLDSNLDGLLEIPEASDWTDLFGRSYNVLYDEALWYRANVCMGLLYEELGKNEKAVDYLTRSQHIRGRILHVFWPSTAAVNERLTTFADQQFNIGDTKYLIAEVSPFNYNWRCDVYGNILAFLFNITDAPRARKSLGFMWGCGVNHPWPVANLYPVVQAGDPDWQPYYTVNLLNLPHHYHNGGIWPLVGGMWVQFAHRLGQEDLARRDLFKLARCCEQGEKFSWEFNEWYHGQTGRPMGKRFQAWSAATYVGAYHELGLHKQQPGGQA